jgi:FkbM family methyltransferase
MDRGQREFWDRYEAVAWEPETLSILRAHLDGRTTFVDIGSWIGPTTLFAAAHARRVIALEPDPVALRQLRRNISLNPELAARIMVLGRALYTKPGVVTLGSTKRGGDSKSSIVHENMHTSWEVETVTPSELGGAIAGDERVFIKIDIEGGEYAVGPQLPPLLGPRTFAVLLSLHPEILIGAGSWRKRLERRLRTAQATNALMAAFSGFALHEARSVSPLRRPDIERLVRRGVCYRALGGTWLMTRA